MLRDVYWRKFPIDLLNDDKMTYIESLMPEKYKYAPYMFYITALKMADDNGIFDLEDGVIFARLMRVKDIDIVFECADLMIARKIIYRLFDDSNYCGLVDWEYPGNQKNKTLEQRRQIVAMQIEEAEKKNHSEKKFRCVGTRNDVPQSESCAGQYNDIPQATERNSAPQNSVFSCPENDKIGENVAQNRMDDKIGENVAPYRENRKDREREQKEKETEQKEQKEKREQIFCSGLSEPTQNICEKKRAAVAVEQKKEKEKKNSESLNVTENLSGKPEKKLKSYEESEDQKALLNYLNDFFVKNCYGYQAKKSVLGIAKLAEKINAVSDEVNPALEIASFLCSEYKKLTEGANKEFNGLPVLPSYIIKPFVWVELMKKAEKILVHGQKQNKFSESAEEAQKEQEQENLNVRDAYEADFIKYGINKDAPDAKIKLLIAKASERKQKAEEADFIF